MIFYIPVIHAYCLSVTKISFCLSRIFILILVKENEINEKCRLNYLENFEGKKT